MKTQQIFITVLVFSVCQWTVLSAVLDGTSPKAVESTPAPAEISTTPQIKEPPVNPNDTTTSSTTTSTTPSTTSSTTSTTTPATTSSTTPSTTSTTTSTTSTTTPATTTSTTVAPTTVAPPTTPTPAPAPVPCRHFDSPSFIGGIVLTIGLIAIGFVAHKIYKSKFDRNYHTL